MRYDEHLDIFHLALRTSNSRYRLAKLEQRLGHPSSPEPRVDSSVPGAFIALVEVLELDRRALHLLSEHGDGVAYVARITASFDQLGPGYNLDAAVEAVVEAYERGSQGARQGRAQDVSDLFVQATQDVAHLSTLVIAD